MCWSFLAGEVSSQEGGWRFTTLNMKFIMEWKWFCDSFGVFFFLCSHSVTCFVVWTQVFSLRWTLAVNSLVKCFVLWWTDSNMNEHLITRLSPNDALNYFPFNCEKYVNYFIYLHVSVFGFFGNMWNQEKYVLGNLRLELLNHLPGTGYTFLAKYLHCFCRLSP